LSYLTVTVAHKDAKGGDDDRAQSKRKACDVSFSANGGECTYGETENANSDECRTQRLPVLVQVIRTRGGHPEELYKRCDYNQQTGRALDHRTEYAPMPAAETERLVRTQARNVRSDAR
jgi:hypothetical protein